MPFELVIGGVIFLNPHVRMSVSRLDGLYVGLSQFPKKSRSYTSQGHHSTFKKVILRTLNMFVGLSLFCLYMVAGFYGYILVSVLYGASLGVYLYVSKVC